MDEDPFIKFYDEVLILMKFLQTKAKVTNMNINYYDLYYSVLKNRKEKDNEEEQKENLDGQYENDYINFNDVIPNHEPRETTLK